MCPIDLLLRHASKRRGDTQLPSPCVRRSCSPRHAYPARVGREGCPAHRPDRRPRDGYGAVSGTGEYAPRAHVASGPDIPGSIPGISVTADACQTPSVPKTRETGLRAVLFTDVVGSTELAREMGDVRWSRLLAAQRRVIRALLKSNGGREVDTAGDGFFAVFDRPADAVRCAFAACSDVQALGLDIRGGVHFGEVELAKSEVHGIVVHTGARVMGHAGACEVLVTATVRDLVAGSKFDLQERGNVELKGVPGTWTLYDVMSVDDRLRPSPIEGASVASERRERAVAAPATEGRGRRWILPAVAGAIVFGVGAAYLLTREDPTYVPTAGTVAAITADGAFGEPVALASEPTAIAWGEGRIWVTDRQGQIYWLDPETGETGSRGAAGAATGVAVGDRAVWVSNGFGVGDGPAGGVSRIDPVDEGLTPAFETPIGSEAIAWGAERVWVTDTATGELRSYDPATRTVESVGLPPVSKTEPARPEDLVVTSSDDAAVWIGDATAGRVFRAPVTAPQEIETFTVPAPVTGIASGHGGVWVTSGGEDTITLLDDGTGAVLTSLDLARTGCDQPEAVAAGADDVWVACRASGTLIRIDPGSNTVTSTLSVAGAPMAVTADDDGIVWLAVGST